MGSFVGFEVCDFFDADFIGKKSSCSPKKSSPKWIDGKMGDLMPGSLTAKAVMKIGRTCPKRKPDRLPVPSFFRGENVQLWMGIHDRVEYTITLNPWSVNESGCCWSISPTWKSLQTVSGTESTFFGVFFDVTSHHDTSPRVL